MSAGDTSLGPLPAGTNPRHASKTTSVFDRLLVQAPRRHRKRSISRDLPSASVNMTGRGRESPDPDYSPGLGEVLVHDEGVFRNTRSRVAIPYSYEQPSSSTALASPQPRRSLQSSDEEDEDSGYASSATVSSVRTDRASVNMAVMLTTIFVGSVRCV